MTEAEYNARLSELDEAYITGLEEERGYGNRQYKMQQFERMEEAQRRMREAIGKRDRFGVKLMEKGDTGDYVIARMENGVTMQKIILSPLEARLLAAEILSKVKPIKRKKEKVMECQVNKPDSTFKTILLCDVCRKNVAHVVCFNSGKENEVRVCKDCMERAMGVFEDDEPKKIPEEKKPEGGYRCHPAKQHRDSVINGLRRDLKKKEDLIKKLKEDLVSTEKAYNNRVKKLVSENTCMKKIPRECQREHGFLQERVQCFRKEVYGLSQGIRETLQRLGQSNDHSSLVGCRSRCNNSSLVNAMKPSEIIIGTILAALAGIFLGAFIVGVVAILTEI